MKNIKLTVEKVIPFVLGIACLYVSRAFAMPMAALFAPVFMIRFLRTQRSVTGAIILSIASSMTMIIAFRGLIDSMFHSAISFGVVMIITTVAGLIPMFLDRYFAFRKPAWQLTLLYPSLKTFLEYIGSLNSPFGAWGASSALFAGWLPFSQIVSVTGIWGLSFLISWFASLINFFWDQRKDLKRSTHAVFTFVTLLLLVSGFGMIRLGTKSSNDQVKVAAVLANDSLHSRIKNDFYRQIGSFSHQAMSGDSLAYFKNAFTENNNFLLDETSESGKKGAKIIFWAEGNGMVLKSDEQLLMMKAEKIAREKQIYIGMSLEVFNPMEKLPVENKIILIKPDGNIAWEYYKHFPIGVENKFMKIGTGGIKTLQTPYGKIAAIICFDSDFIQFARTVGKSGADILFAPSNDWEAIAAIRGKITRFRALENGVTLVRPTSHGVTEMVDSKGKMIYSNNYFQNPQTILMADIPVKGHPSFYPFAGDWFAIFSFIIFLTIIIMIQIKKRKKTHMTKPLIITGIILTGIIPSVHSQSKTIIINQEDNDTIILKEKPKPIIFPCVSYSPETSVALGLSAIRLFNTKDSKSSQIAATGLYTFKNQFLIETHAQVYFHENKFQAKGDLKIEKYPEYFFGIGNKTDENSKNLVNFHAVKLEGSLMKKIRNNLYGGPKIYFSDYFNVNPGQEIGKITGVKGGITTGVGLNVVYDTRDNIFSSSKGMIAEISSVWNTNRLGGDFHYYSLDADFRKFFPVTRNTVIGLQALSLVKTGEVPFLQLSYLGGSNIMRGYYSGRYRDKTLLAAQVEVRQQLSRRWAFVIFGGYGEVMEELKQFSVQDLHPSFGGGVRRRISKTDKVNLRIDVGVVKGKPDFYLNIAEAF